MFRNMKRFGLGTSGCSNVLIWRVELFFSSFRVVRILVRTQFGMIIVGMPVSESRK